MRLASWLAASGLIVALAWLAGFAWFVRGALQTADPRAAADGIVVLTGGADRVSAGLHLLAGGRGRLLLISGVGRGVGLSGLMRAAGEEDQTLVPRITLGRVATTTTGNAEETASWAREHGLHALLVVTAGYHMRRALREIGRAAPDLDLRPVPVMPPALRDAGGLSTVRLLAHEYDKFLASALGLTRFQVGLEAG